MKEIRQRIVPIKTILRELTAILGAVYTPQNGACAPLSGARERKLVAGVAEGSILRVCAWSSVTT